MANQSVQLKNDVKVAVVTQHCFMTKLWSLWKIKVIHRKTIDIHFTAKIFTLKQDDIKSGYSQSFPCKFGHLKKAICEMQNQHIVDMKT